MTWAAKTTTQLFGKSASNEKLLFSIWSCRRNRVRFVTLIMPPESTTPGFSLIPGSERQRYALGRIIGPCDPNEPVRVTVMVRRQNASEFKRLVRQFEQDKKSAPVEPLSSEEFKQRFGAAAADVEAISEFASRAGLQVFETDIARRIVVLSGTVEKMNKAFGVELQKCEAGNRTYRVREGGIYVPETIAGIVTGVFGLDERPQAKHHFRLQSAATQAVSYSPIEVANLYNFPPNTTGAGETVGVIELGGGFETSDLESFFQGLGISTPPQVTAVSVDGAQNVPGGDPTGADGEVELDIEVVGAVAPGAAQKVYFAPNTDQGFMDAVSTAIQDTEVSIVTISWGEAESEYTAQTLTSFNEIFAEAVTLGKTVFVASGDNGSSDGVADGQNHVDFPSSSPYVVGCGGTTLEASADDSTIVSETVWNEEAAGLGATGGGVSDVFPLPDYQANANVPAPQNPNGGRGVPDVSGDADPDTGYTVLIDGTMQVIGGTSAVAPLYAGLFARINEALRAQNLPRAGFVNPQLYNFPGAFNDITIGNNGAFQAGPGWDAASGLGSPNGNSLLADLSLPSNSGQASP
jgi:kumamolisin